VFRERVHLSKGSLLRALRILDALFKALETRGGSVHLDPERGERTYVKIGDEKVGIRMEEEFTRKDHVPTRADKPYLVPKWDYVATGNLTFHASVVASGLEAIRGAGQMLEHTFVHIPGIGRTTEQGLWEQGVRTWADAGGMEPGSLRVRPQALAQLRRYLPESRRALQEKNAGFFSRLCGLGEAWRVFSRFAQDCVYLDIETTGLSPGYDDITLVGVYDGEAYKAFIAGDNLDVLPEYLQRFRLISTFNGASFDLRFIRAAFPHLALPPIHIDLRRVTKKLGLTGGLKAIEASLGLQRDLAVRDLSGFDAVILWRRYLQGDRQALDLLVEYNRADVVHLKTIMETCYDRLTTETRTLFNAPRPNSHVRSVDGARR
jgi:hypothetical protein